MISKFRIRTADIMVRITKSVGKLGFLYSIIKQWQKCTHFWSSLKSTSNSITCTQVCQSNDNDL